MKTKTNTHITFTPSTDNEYLSSTIFDSKPTLVIPKGDTDDHIHDGLTAFQDLVKLLNSMGWLDHTGDWDLGLDITLHNGSKIQTEQGYPEFEINREKGVIITNIDLSSDYDEDEEENMEILIKDIHTIALYD